MIDPRAAEKSSISSRLALAMALLLAGGFGLAATYLVKPTVLRAGASDGAPEVAAPVVIPKAKTKPSPPAATAANDLIAFCSTHVTARRSFVVFRYGTCVVVDEPSTDPVGDARARLEACDDPEARFVPELTAEGNLLVSFKEPVFHNFTPTERETIQNELNRLTPALLTPKERVSAGDDWVPPTHARFGLLARRRMLEDAARPVAVKIIRAKDRATVRND